LAYSLNPLLLLRLLLGLLLLGLSHGEYARTAVAQCRRHPARPILLRCRGRRE
jgi:hypothetical protein